MAKSASYSECFAALTSFFDPPHAASTATNAEKMVRFDELMGRRLRNSTRNATPERAAQIAALLAEKWPDATCELDHTNAYQLLLATLLAAHSTDKVIRTIR